MARHANTAIFIPHAGCPHQCSFCNQRAISGQTRPVQPEEVTAVCERALATMKMGASDAEIAFFGGSFTAIPREYMRSLLEAAAPYVRAGRFRGIRLSTRPDCVDEAVLALLKGYGVTAVELGAQCMDDRVLALNGRGHTAADVERASRLIREAGLELGLQMMTGLPGADDEADRETARRLAALTPDTVRIYPTLVMRGTPLAAWLSKGRYVPPSLETAAALCADLLWFFEEEQGIPVIRLGLHAEGSLQENYLAGPWHPAFRELCESRLYLEAARRALAGCAGGPVALYVHPAALSKMIGQRRQNLAALAGEGFEAAVRPDGTLPLRRVRAVPVSNRK